MQKITLNNYIMAQPVKNPYKILPAYAALCLLLLLIFSDTSNINLIPISELSQNRYKKGLQAKHQGKFEIAQQCFKKAILNSPNFLPAYQELISICRDSVSLLKADTLFAALANIKKKNPGPIFGKALIYLRQWKLKNAVELLQRCALRFKHNKYVLLKLAEAMRYRGYFKDSNSFLKKILILPEAANDASLKAQIFDLMGENWYDMGQLQAAEKLHNTSRRLARQINDQAREASALKNLCRVNFRREDYLKAEKCIYEAIPLARASGDSLILAHCLRNLGVIYWLRGIHRTAMSEGYEPALRIYRSLDHRFGEAVTLSDIGLVFYHQQDYFTHLRYQQQALAIQEEIGDLKGQAYTTYFIAQIHYRIGEGIEAIKCFRKAFRIADEIDYFWVQQSAASNAYKPLGKKMAKQYKRSIPGYKSIAEQRTAAGMASWLGQYQKSLTATRRLLPLARQQNDAKSLAGYHIVMGNCYFYLDQPDSAALHFQKCKYIADSIRIRIWQFHARYGLGNIAEKKKEWRTALAIYLDAAKHNEKVYENTGGSKLQVSWAGRMADCDLAIIRMLIRLGNENKNRTEYYHRAFRHWQSATARHFNQLIAQNNPPAIPAVENHHSEISNLQRYLPTGTSYIGYLVDEFQTFIFILTETVFDILEVPIQRRNLEGKVELARILLEQVNYPNGTNVEATWQIVLKSLFNVLIRPIQNAGYLSDIENLIISPARVLHHLPFACIIGSDTLKVTPLSLRKSPYLSRDEFFLAEKYNVSYLPSPEMLQPRGNDLQAHSVFSNATGLILAPFPDRFQGIRKEAETLSARLNSSGKYLMGTAATEAAFKAEAKKYDLIHFATHSHLAVDTPESTFVELRASAGEDGLLTVAEIIKLKLNAALVVLSSCESGLGASRFGEPDRAFNYHPNDEFIGLTRAFLIAGAQQVLSTGWPVQDAASAEFMALFYENLATLPPAAAVAASQRAFIINNHTNDPTSNLPFSHPYLWGAYKLVYLP